MHKTSAAFAAAVLAGSAAVVVGVSAGPAVAVAGSAGATLAVETLPLSAAHPLPVSSVSDLIVDAANRHVLVSDAEAGRLVVTNFGGTVLAVRDGLKGIAGLALTADSGTIYAAQADAHAIVAFDAKTVTETARYPVGDEVYPHHVALAGGKVWFGYKGDYEHADHAGSFGSLDLSGAAPAVRLHDATTDNSAFMMAPFVVSSAAAPDVLVVADSSTFSATTSVGRVYDVSGGTERLLKTGRVADDWIHDLSLSADGAHILATDNCGVARTSVAGNAWRERLYQPGCNAAELGLATDGRVAVGYVSSDTLPDIFLYPAGSQTQEKSFYFPQVDAHAVDLLHTIAWEPGGDRVFAVSRGDSYRLWTVQGPAFPTPALKVSGPATAPRAKALTLTGTITAATSLPAGTELTVRRTDLESPSGKTVGTATTGAAGAFRFTDTPPAGGTVRYTISYAGSVDHNAASATATVQVSRTTPALTIDQNKGVHAYGTTVTFTAKLGATYRNRTVEIWADPFGGDKGSNLVKKATVNGAGKVSASIKLTRNTTVSAKFTGDARTAPRTATSTVYTKVAISMKVYKHYKTGKIGGTTYHYFKTSKDPFFTVKMTAHPGRSQHFVVQKYSGGKWKNWPSDYFRLDGSGWSGIDLVGTFEAGSKFRVRSEYVRGNAGDTVNYTTYGAWRYLTFRK